jgi:hypothetical protein
MATENYFAYDPEFGFETYATQELAEAAANKLIADYAENAAEGWDEMVSQVVWGEIKQRATEFKTGHIVEFEGEQVECVDYKLENV